MPRFLIIAALLAAIAAAGAGYYYHSVSGPAPVMAETTVFTPPSEGAPMLLPVDPDPLIVETRDGERRFSIEVADSDAERAAGLMFRRTMPDDRAMLFVFETTRRLSFWMQNTPMPLDLIFIDEDGIVLAILPGIPFSTASIGPSEDARFVLEVKSGIAQRNGISPGDRLRHPRIDSIAG